MEIFAKSHISRHDSKTVYYRKFKNFNGNSFLHNLKINQLRSPINDPNENQRSTAYTFISNEKHHVPLKKTFFRVNSAPFMKKDLRKVIYRR